jgi:hypothetical protein
VRGYERGLVLVRSFWRADVRIDPWEPEFEIEHRRIVPRSAATLYVLGTGGAVDRIHLRALVEADLVGDET